MYYYNSLSDNLIKKYGEKVYKLSLDVFNTCPNRDGTKGVGGCIFCANGSGDFASKKPSVKEQIEDAKRLVSAKTKGSKYIAYFQAYTNTYAPVEVLRKNFFEAANEPQIVEISIATRPDCLGDDVIGLLSELNSVKPVTVELGLQTANDRTAELINRCYKTEVFDFAVSRLKERGIETVAHVILGLPNETVDDMIATVKHLNEVGVDGVKLQLLHVLKGTELEKMYERREFEVLTLEEYAQILRKCVENLSKDVVIHRLTGDAPKKLLVAPFWSADKKRVLNYIRKEFDRWGVTQGRYCGDR